MSDSDADKILFVMSVNCFTPQSNYIEINITGQIINDVLIEVLKTTEYIW